MTETQKDTIQLRMMGVGLPDIGEIESRPSIWLEREDYSWFSDNEWNTLVDSVEVLISEINDDIEEMVDERITDYVDTIVDRYIHSEGNPHSPIKDMEVSN